MNVVKSKFHDDDEITQYVEKFKSFQVNFIGHPFRENNSESGFVDIFKKFCGIPFPNTFEYTGGQFKLSNDVDDSNMYSIARSLVEGLNGNDQDTVEESSQMTCHDIDDDKYAVNLYDESFLQEETSSQDDGFSFLLQECTFEENKQVAYVKHIEDQLNMAVTNIKKVLQQKEDDEAILKKNNDLVIARMNEQKQAVTNRFKLLENHLKEVQNENKTYCDEISSKQSKIDASEHQKDKLQQRILQLLHEKDTLLSEQKTHHEMELSRAKEENEKLNVQIEKLTSNVDQQKSYYEIELSKVKYENKRIYAQLQKLEHELDESVSKRKKLQRHLEEASNLLN